MNRRTIGRRLALALALFLSLMSRTPAAEADQPPYLKKATWQETFDASLKALFKWEKTSAPQGLGYAIDGRMGGRRVLTTSVLRREGDEVETLSWRYTLG